METNENEEDSPPSLKRKLSLRHSAVKVRKQNCVDDTISVKINFQSGSSSSLKTRKPLCLNPLEVLEYQRKPHSEVTYDYEGKVTIIRG